MRIAQTNELHNQQPL